MKKEKLVASALAFNTLLTAFTINVKAKTLDVPYIYEEEKNPIYRKQRKRNDTEKTRSGNGNKVF